MPELESLPRRRLAKLFHFLQAFNEYQFPVTQRLDEQLWQLWLTGLPEHPTLQEGMGEGGEEGFVLRVGRPELTPPPEPPEPLRRWLLPGWQGVTGEVTVREEIAQGEDIRRFADGAELAGLLAEWSKRREHWATSETSARRAMEVFQDLYALYGRIQREAEVVELMLGDGHLHWLTAKTEVDHPVLLRRLNLVFDPSVPEFRFTETDEDTELYGGLFNSLSIDGRTLAGSRSELAEGEVHPLGGDETTDFLRRLVARLGPEGAVIEHGAPVGNGPTISRSPVIFLRKRTTGYAEAIDGVLEDIAGREDFPGALLSIVGVRAEDRPAEDALETKGLSEPQPDVLYSKPTNPEQVRIAERLERSSGLSVQGPPGTGKTHTIANLIGHLLAQGKQVLVTSHTPKSLRVLREKVVAPLQPLCVSVLDGGSESRSQLEASVHAIAEHLSADTVRLQREIQSLTATRGALKDKIAAADRELLDARSAEYRPITVAGEAYEPSEAARRVARNAREDGWLPSPVTPGAPLPLSTAELSALYASNVAVSMDEEAQIVGGLPDPATLPAPEAFSRLAMRVRTGPKDQSFEPTLWKREVPLDAAELTALRQTAAETTKVDASAPWQLALLQAGRDTASRQPWESLAALIEAVRGEALALQDNLLRYGPALTSRSDLDAQQQAAEAILAHVEHGGRLGALDLVLHRNWKGTMALWRVSGKAPTLEAHFRAILDLLRLELSREELRARWNRQMAALGAPKVEELGQEPEVGCAQFLGAIRRLLGWHDQSVGPVLKRLESAGFDFQGILDRQAPEPGPYGDLERLRKTMSGPLQAQITGKLLVVERDAAMTRLQEVTELLPASVHGTAVSALRNAVRRLAVEEYASAYAEVVRLWTLHQGLADRNSLLARLAGRAPAWAAAIKERAGVHGQASPPGDAEAAWLWRQLSDELDRRGKVALSAVQERRERLDAELREVTAALIEKMAWLRQIQRTTDSQRQALVGYLDLVRRIGKGTGKRVPRLRAQVRETMRECRTAVPVWIMPLSQVVQTFDPKETRFDVVIIDEASQCDLRGLVALYVADKVVVVGDHEQVSPDSVGLEVDFVQRLIDEHLEGIPNKMLYDGQASIYDLARQAFGGVIGAPQRLSRRPWLEGC